MSTQTDGSGLKGVFKIGFRRTTAVVTAMLLLDILWWWLLLNTHVPMPGMTWLMDHGVPMTAPGAMELSTARVGTLRAVSEYFLMWGVMMWAMMYPAMTRFTRDYAAALRGNSFAVACGVAAFLLGYNVVWMISAVIPLGLQVTVPSSIHAVTESHTTLVVGGVLVLAGVYQLTAFKQSLLRTCCEEVEPRQASPVRSLRSGLVHGSSCVTVCFGYFFLVMPFFGSMNPFWMIALTLPVTVERLPASWGRELSVGLGIVTLIAGSVVLTIQPPLPIDFGP